jgi:cell division septum initiation protein DivIVA
MADEKLITKGALAELQDRVIQALEYYQGEIARLTEENQTLKEDNTRLREQLETGPLGY